jgi:spore germination cell wall hydrolase CwlJ-like protein
VTFKGFVNRVSLALSLIVLFGFIAIIWYFQSDGYLQRERNCLEKNVWHEARGEPYQGKLAVGLVTALRTVSGKYSYSLCVTVYERRQFSWTSEPEKIPTARDAAVYKGIQNIAANVVELKKNPKALLRAAAELGIPPDGYFYKRTDNVGVGEGGKDYFDRCLVEVKDPKDPTSQKHLVIGAHGFHRPRPGGCLPRAQPKAEPKNIEKKK